VLTAWDLKAATGVVVATQSVYGDFTYFHQGRHAVFTVGQIWANSRPTAEYAVEWFDTKSQTSQIVWKSKTCKFGHAADGDARKFYVLLDCHHNWPLLTIGAFDFGTGVMVRECNHCSRC
jgi:hypothetical protein